MTTQRNTTNMFKKKRNSTKRPPESVDTFTFHHALRRFPNTSVHHRPPQWCTAFAFRLEVWEIVCRLISYKACQNCTQLNKIYIWIYDLLKTQKTWQNQHGSIHKTNLIRFVNFNEPHWRCFSAPSSLPIDPNKTRPRITLMPLVMGPFLYKNSRLLDESQENIMSRESVFPPKISGYSMIFLSPFQSNGLNLYRCGKWVCLFKQNYVSFRSHRVIWKTEAVPSFRSKLLALLGWYLWYPLQLCRYPMMSLLKLSPSNGMVESISANTHQDLREFDS